MVGTITSGIASGASAGFMQSKSYRIFQGSSAAANTATGIATGIVDGIIEKQKIDLAYKQATDTLNAQQNDLRSVTNDTLSKGDGLARLLLNKESVGNTGLSLIYNTLDTTTIRNAYENFLRKGYSASEYLSVTSVNDLIHRHRFTYMEAFGFSKCIGGKVPTYAIMDIEARFNKGVEMWTPHNATELERLGDYTYEN